MFAIMNKAAMKTVMYVQVFLKERLLQMGFWALRHIPLRNFFLTVDPLNI